MASLLKKTALTVVVLAAAGLAVGGAALVELRRYAERPMDLGDRQVSVRLAPGEPFGKTAAQLAAAGVIQHPLRFKLLARLRGDDKRLKAGEYVFTGPVTPRAVIETLVSGKVKLYRITVPEGYTMAQIARLVEEAGLAKAGDFLDQARRSELLAGLGVEAETLEGYLFPDTYLFPREVAAGEIVAAMVRRFQEVFTSEFRRRAAELGLSVHETVTLASIIEKETGAPHERALISSVFHNRLKRGMRLEADPTVIYGIENFDGNLTRQHLRTPSAYNTYLIQGLPPGPIANPGREALWAALHPAETDFLFFVAKRDGTHQFSSTLAAHRAAVRRYQLKKAPSAGSSE